MVKSKIVVSWSSGKDSAFMLYKLLQDRNYDIAGLLTVVTDDYKRVAMHGVRETLLELQAERLNLPLYKIHIPKDCSSELYQQKMAEVILELEEMHVFYITFGDIFLDNIKKYRETQLFQTSIAPLFPLWGEEPSILTQKIIEFGIKAVIICVDTKKLSSEFIGCEYNNDFISGLPDNVDPCGENGEFHTFVYDAAMFSAPIYMQKGIVVQRGDFMFGDVM